MDWIVFAVQWTHVPLGILWFGTVRADLAPRARRNRGDVRVGTARRRAGDPGDGRGAGRSGRGEATRSLASATDRVKRLVTVELLGFMVIFTCMILMRFGL